MLEHMSVHREHANKTECSRTETLSPERRACTTGLWLAPGNLGFRRVAISP